MGNIESIYSIVSRWNEEDRIVTYSGPKCDVIEIQSKKETVLTGVGIVRPISSSSEVLVEITNVSDNTTILSDRLQVSPDKKQKNHIKFLKEKVTLKAGRVYRVRVIYGGDDCCTYDGTLPVIKNKQHVINIRRNLDASTESNHHQFNLITDLAFEISERGTFCS